MARRTVLTSRQRSALFALPQREADLLRHYTLSDEDLQNIGAKRRPRNKLGFALQLCVLRHPGRLLVPAEFVPPPVVDFIGRQIDLDGDELADYAVRSETRHEHAELRHLYGFRSFSGGAARELGDRLREEAPQAQSNEDLVRRFVEACRRTRTILPATTTIERLCADALVDAERRIEARIAERVPPGLRRDLEHLLDETVDAGVTRFVWLRQFEPGSNSAAANRLLDRLEHLRRLNVPEGLFHDIPPHRISPSSVLYSFLTSSADFCVMFMRLTSPISRRGLGERRNGAGGHASGACQGGMPRFGRAALAATAAPRCVASRCRVRTARATPPFTNRTSRVSPSCFGLPAADRDEHPVAVDRVIDVGPARSPSLRGLAAAAPRCRGRWQSGEGPLAPVAGAGGLAGEARPGSTPRPPPSRRSPAPSP